MKEKYVEQAFPRWFEFGVSPEEGVDISNGNRDVFTRVSPEQADELIRIRNAYVDAMCAFFEKHPETLCKRVQS